MFRTLLTTTVFSTLLAGISFAQALPDHYPADYADLIEQAKEEGSLLIYSNMGPENWEPLIAAFNDHYPEIKVETLDLGPGEVFTRYRAETGTGVATADMLAAGTIGDWIQAANDGLIVDYKSPEAEFLPEWSLPMPGVYTFSADPMILMYNKVLVPEELRTASMEEFFANIVAHPEVFDGKIGTYDGQFAFGESINYAFVRHHGDKAWEWFDAIGPSVRPGGGTGGMIEKTVSGENTASYFASGPVLFPRLKQGIGEIIDWKFPSDGTPVFLRGVGVTEKAPHPAAARLMLDFLLSEEGQYAVAEGKLTAYRPGVKPEGETSYSLDEVIEEIGGEEKMILIDYDPDMLEDHDDFIARWAEAFGM